MSIKKELLNELSEKQLREFAGDKGIKFDLNSIQKEYYAQWNEKDKLVDLITDNQQVSISDIERFILERKD